MRPDGGLQREFPSRRPHIELTTGRTKCTRHQPTLPALPSTGHPCALTAVTALPFAAQPLDSHVLQISPSTSQPARHARTWRRISPAPSTTDFGHGDSAAARYLIVSGPDKRSHKDSSAERVGVSALRPGTRCSLHSRPPASFMKCSGIWPRPRLEPSIKTPQSVRGSSGSGSSKPWAASCRSYLRSIFQGSTHR